MTSKFFIACVSIVLLPLSLAQAKVYVWTLADGTKIYSDKPQPRNGQQPTEHTAKPINRMSPNQGKVSTMEGVAHAEKDGIDEKPKDLPYINCSIISPISDSVLLASQLGNSPIKTSLVPPL